MAKAKAKAKAGAAQKRTFREVLDDGTQEALGTASDNGRVLTLVERQRQAEKKTSPKSKAKRAVKTSHAEILEQVRRAKFDTFSKHLSYEEMHENVHDGKTLNQRLIDDHIAKAEGDASVQFGKYYTKERVREYKKTLTRTSRASKRSTTHSPSTTN